MSRLASEGSAARDWRRAIRSLPRQCSLTRQSRPANRGDDDSFTRTRGKLADQSEPTLQPRRIGNQSAARQLQGPRNGYSRRWAARIAELEEGKEHGTHMRISLFHLQEAGVEGPG